MITSKLLLKFLVGINEKGKNTYKTATIKVRPGATDDQLRGFVSAYSSLTSNELVEARVVTTRDLTDEDLDQGIAGTDVIKEVGSELDESGSKQECESASNNGVMAVSGSKNAAFEVDDGAVSVTGIEMVPKNRGRLPKELRNGIPQTKRMNPPMKRGNKTKKKESRKKRC